MSLEALLFSRLSILTLDKPTFRIAKLWNIFEIANGKYWFLERIYHLSEVGISQECKIGGWVNGNEQNFTEEWGS